MNTAPTLDPAVQTLLPELKGISFDSGESLEFSGVSFKFFLCNPDPTEPPAWYHSCRLVGECDVYVQEHTTDRRRLLFHEIVEASLVHQHVPIDEAHQYALEQEELVFGPRAAA